MATTYEAKSYDHGTAVSASTFPGSIKRAVSVNLEQATNDATYAFAQNDLIKVFHLPPYVKVLHARLVTTATELDDHATPTLDLDLVVSNGTVTKTAVNGGTAINQANVTATMDYDTDDAYMFCTPNGEYYVALKAIAASAGDAEANASIIVEFEYTNVLELGEVNMAVGRDGTL